MCSCQREFIGSPPNCRPECIVSSDCAQNLACQNQKCIDPCPGTCGAEARCQVINHYAACSCPNGYTGDPFNKCLKLETCKHNVYIRHQHQQFNTIPKNIELLCIRRIYLSISLCIYISLSLSLLFHFLYSFIYRTFLIDCVGRFIGGCCV